MTARARYGIEQWALGIVGCVGVAGCLAGCGGSGPTSNNAGHHIGTHAGTLDAARLESAIATSAQSQRQARATVDCPAAVQLKTGRHFYCVAEVGSRNTPFLVTERDATGYVSYRGIQSSRAPLLDGGIVASAIKHSIFQTRHVGASVSCPTGIPRQQGLQFVCLATVHGAGTTQFVVSELDGAGHVRYRPR